MCGSCIERFDPRSIFNKLRRGRCPGLWVHFGSAVSNDYTVISIRFGEFTG